MFVVDLYILTRVCQDVFGEYISKKLVLMANAVKNYLRFSVGVTSYPKHKNPTKKIKSVKYFPRMLYKLLSKTDAASTRSFTSKTNQIWMA